MYSFFYVFNNYFWIHRTLTTEISILNRHLMMSVDLCSLFHLNLTQFYTFFIWRKFTSNFFAQLKSFPTFAQRIRRVSSCDFEIFLRKLLNKSNARRCIPSCFNLFLFCLFLDNKRFKRPRLSDYLWSF